MKHVVQVGLNKTTEYNFLAPAHFGKRRRDLYILPYDLDMSGDWMYHGIECNPEIFAEHRETLYLETPSEKFYNVAITGTDGTTVVEDYKNRHDKYVQGHRIEIEVPSKTLETFFRDAGIDRCHLLCTDIQGWEYPAFQAYQGIIPIELAIVEFHVNSYREDARYPQSTTPDVFETLCREKGFEIVCRYKKNRTNIEYHLRRKSVS